MFTKSSNWQRLSILVAFAAVAAAAACSGGGNPTAVYPAGANNGVASAGSYQLPTTNGFNSTMLVSGTGTLSLSSSASAPSVGAIPQAKQRAQTGSSNSGLVYYTVTATSALTIKSISVSIGFTSPPTTSVYLAYWNGTEWVANSTPGTYSAGAVALTLPNSAFPITLTSGQSLYLVAYEGQQIGTPVPAPPAVSPSVLTISEGTAQTVTVMSKPGFTITAASSNTGIVTVSPTSAPVPSPSAGSSLGSVTFTLTAAYAAGTATVSFTDSIGQTTNVQVTTNDNYAPPSPPATATISLGDTLGVTIITQPNSTVTATSSNTAVATVPASATAAGGNASFTITSVAAGTTTITFTDAFGNSGSMVLTVSGVKNGAFTSGMANWTNCSYAHTALTAAVNESTPSPVIPLPTQSPGAATAAVATTSLTGLSAQVTPPPNDNPSPPAGVTSPAPSVLGNYVALVGTINAATVASPKGEFGICQQIVVPSSPSALYLSFWEWEGNTEYTFKDADEDAVILDSTGTTVQQTLFVENHCYADALIGQAPGQATSSGCWPAAYGGDSGDFKDWIGGGFWTQRGPYNLSAYAGQTITLYLGNWSFFANAASKYANFIYVGNVQLIPSATFPTVTTSHANRTTYTMTLKHP